MNQEEKSAFIQAEMFLLLQNISEKQIPLWGKMNAQQMLEHLNDFFEVSIEKIIFPLVTPKEYLPKYREFLYSDKAFRENTKAPASVLGDDPLPVKTASIQAAKEKLQDTVHSFFEFFKTQPNNKTLHPVFGLLSFEEWIMLHYKHVMHHYRQFALIP
ncbi:MAG TPA: DUF1569 domain-containing protein [Ferruginibacter sp.]|nr:DUF1569 domain-containing protein [Ferruginibacter sp.]